MVRPVELQDLFAKTQAAERITQLQKAQLENQQRQVAAETAHRASDRQRKTMPSVKPDEVILHRDRDENKKDKNGKKSETDRQNEETQSDAERNSEDETRTEEAAADDAEDTPPHLDLTA